MFLDYKDLINLPVETQSGQYLGKVAGLTLETDSQSVYQYHVKPAGLGGLFSHELLIHRQQVISVDDQKMVVDDLVYKKLAAAKAGAVKNPIPAEVITTSE